MRLGMVPSHDGEAATPEVALCQSRGWVDIAKLVVGEGKFVYLEKCLSKSKLELKVVASLRITDTRPHFHYVKISKQKVAQLFKAHRVTFSLWLFAAILVYPKAYSIDPCQQRHLWYSIC